MASPTPTPSATTRTTQALGDGTCLLASDGMLIASLITAQALGGGGGVVAPVCL